MCVLLPIAPVQIACKGTPGSTDSSLVSDGGDGDRGGGGGFGGRGGCELPSRFLSLLQLCFAAIATLSDLPAQQRTDFWCGIMADGDRDGDRGGGGFGGRGGCELL